jgi:hypothetical protein
MSDQDVTARLRGLNVDQLKRLVDAAEDRIDQVAIRSGAASVAPAVQACREAYLAHPDWVLTREQAMAWISQQAAVRRQRQPATA